MKLELRKRPTKLWRRKRRWGLSAVLRGAGVSAGRGVAAVLLP